MDRPRLRDVILSRIDNGDLPVTSPPKIFTTYGSNNLCNGCGGRILPPQVEYQWGYPHQPRVFRMHIGCAVLWEILRQQRGSDPAFGSR